MTLLNLSRYTKSLVKSNSLPFPEVYCGRVDRSGNFLGRFLFASLVTYLATQAHGWAGGVATPYWFTVLTWLVVSLGSLRIKSRLLLLVVSVGVQLAIHFGSMNSHAHNMNTSEEAMLIGHTLAGIAAWAITVLSEDRFYAISWSLSLFKFAAPVSRQLKTFNYSIKSFVSKIIAKNKYGRAPPALSSY